MGDTYKTELERDLEKEIEGRNHFFMEITSEQFKKRMETYRDSMPIPSEDPFDKAEFSIDGLADWKTGRRKQDSEIVNEWGEKSRRR